jgi:lipopolysaccharide export system protein LptA
MKTKYTVVIVAIALGLAATLYATEQQTANAATKIIILKSHGVAVAELRVLTRDSLQINGMKQNLDAMTGVLTAKGGVTVQLGSAGDSQITIKADEVEVSPIAK